MKKIVFQLWLDFDDLGTIRPDPWTPEHVPAGSPKEDGMPVAWREARAHAIAVNPDWTFALLDSSDARTFLRHAFPGRIEETYDNFPYGIQRADFVRIALLYVYGGMYIDLDFETLKSFDRIEVNAPIVLSRSPNTPSYVTNDMMISRDERHPFWLAYLEEMCKEPGFLIRILRHVEVMHTTGPAALTRVMKAWPRKDEDIDVSSGIVVMCDMCHSGADACPYSKDHVFKPLAGASWHSWDSRLINHAYCNATAWVLCCCSLLLAFCIIAIVRC